MFLRPLGAEAAEAGVEGGGGRPPAPDGRGEEARGHGHRREISPARASVGASDGLSFSQVEGVELVAQPHGGALIRGGTREGHSKGVRVTAERRRAPAEWSEADDAMVGHVEKMSEIIAQLVEEAGGEQYRCPQCGSFGPKVSDH